MKKQLNEWKLSLLIVSASFSLHAQTGCWLEAPPVMTPGKTLVVENVCPGDAKWPTPAQQGGLDVKITLPKDRACTTRGRVGGTQSNPSHNIWVIGGEIDIKGVDGSAALSIADWSGTAFIEGIEIDLNNTQNDGIRSQRTTKAGTSRVVIQNSFIRGMGYGTLTHGDLFHAQGYAGVTTQVKELVLQNVRGDLINQGLFVPFRAQNDHGVRRMVLDHVELHLDSRFKFAMNKISTMIFAGPGGANGDDYPPDGQKYNEVYLNWWDPWYPGTTNRTNITVPAPSSYDGQGCAIFSAANISAGKIEGKWCKGNPPSTFVPLNKIGRNYDRSYFTSNCNGCTGKPVTGVSVNKATTSIPLCRTEQLSAVIAPGDACDQTVTWSSDNTAVATVDASGVVTAVSTGTANIKTTTNDGGFTSSCAVTVTDVQAAYNNVSRTIPGRIEAEDYDDGGQCVAYNDVDAGNAGNQYRSEDVDIKVSGDPQGGGYDVGWTSTGEWMEYTLNATAGTYNMNVRVGSAGSGGSITVKLDGLTLGTVNVPNMGNWNDKSTQTIPNITIAGGAKKILRLEIAGSGGVDINWIEFNGITTGINSGETGLGLAVYPNPSEGIFTIKYDGAEKNINMTVTDVLGRTIISKKYETGEINDQLDLSKFPDGIYTLKLETGNQIKTMKLLKQ